MKRIYPKEVREEILEEYPTIEAFEKQGNIEYQCSLILTFRSCFERSREIELEPLTRNVLAAALLFLAEDKNVHPKAKQFLK